MKTRYKPKLMVAPNGARRNKADHSNLPITLEEIVAEAIACANAGADSLHLHVRDTNGQHSLDAGLYRETLDAIFEALPLLYVQVTTEAAGIYNVDQQIETLSRLQPAAVSIAIREIARAPALARDVYELCDELQIDVQHILYSQADMNQLLEWRDLGIVQGNQPNVLFVLGAYSPPRDAKIQDVQELISFKPAELSDWMVCAFGPSEHSVLLEAAYHGAGVRVGFENNIHSAQGVLARSNAENVAALSAAISSAKQKRKLLI